ncbi:MAG: alpha/beta hydrolase [Clostridia bacterium]
MPKLVSNLMRAQIALLNPLLKRMDLSTMRKLQDMLGGLGARVVTDAVSFEDAPFDVFDAVWAIPKAAVAGKAILYLHGGSYTAGSLAYCKGFGGLLAEQTGYATLCVAYRLAPEHPFPAALDDALGAYRFLLESRQPGDIALVGESAGGGLCYCLALQLREMGLALPVCIVALSPWTDLTLASPSCTENLPLEPLLNKEGLAYSAQLYGGTDLENPLISPLFGDMTGLPPSLIYAGTHEILEDDSVLMAKKLTSAHCACELHVAEGMWHAYVLYGIPEAREAIERMNEFITEALRHG